MMSPSTNRPARLPPADRVCVAALALALPLALGSLPAFGYWEKAELLPILLHLAGALGAFGLIAGQVSGSGAARAALRHPQVLVVAVPAGWALLSAPFVELPLLSLAGTVQSGFGALWFFDLAVLVACGLVARHHAGTWTGLRWWATAVALILAALKFHDWLRDEHLLIYVAAYYGWIGLALAASLPCDRPRRFPWALPVTGMIAAAALALVSLSATVMALLIIGAAFVAIGWLGRERTLLVALTASRGAAIALVGGAALLPYALLRWIPALGQWESLRDRQLLQRMMHAALNEQSVAGWLVGNGWGRTQDAFHAHLDVTGENLWRPTWIFLQSDYFHAHNWMLETLFAAGLPGMMMSFAAILAIPLFAAPERRIVATAFATALAAIGSLWFPLAVSVPFIALAIASVSHQAVRHPLPTRPVVTALALGALLQIGMVHVQTGFIRDVEAFRAGRLATFPSDPRGSDLTASEVIRDDMNTLAEAKTRKPEDLPRALAMVDHLAQRVPDSTSSHFLVTAVNVMTRIYGSGDLFWLAPHLGHGKEFWRIAVERVLAVAPRRTDSLISYLTHHAMTGDLAETARVTKAILTKSPNDPVGLYFAGLLLVLDPSPEAKRLGIEKLRASADAGIERFMPLDQTVKDLITRQDAWRIP